MRWWVLALCACNRVFGIETTDLVDASTMVPPDARVECPAYGTVPKFSQEIVAFSQQTCGDYTISAAGGFAIAACSDGAPHICAGEIASDLVPIASFEPDGMRQFGQPRLAPEGDELFLRIQPLPAGSAAVARYRRNADLTWSQASVLDLGFPVLALAGVTSRASPRRMFVQLDTATPEANNLHELEETAVDHWVERAVYTPSDLGLSAAPANVDVTADGLRLIYNPSSYVAGQDYLYYADRPDLASRFESGVRISTILANFGGYLTEHCDRFYFPALGKLYYAVGQAP